MATSTLKTSLKKGEFRAVLNFKAFIHLFKLSFLSCSKTNAEVKPFMTADFLGTFFFNLFDCRFVFAPSCFTDTYPLGTDTSLLRTVCFVPWEGKALIWTLSMTPSGSILKWFDCTENAKFTTSAWLKSINLNKISDYFLLLLLLLLTSFADGVTRNLLPCQSNNIS